LARRVEVDMPQTVLMPPSHRNGRCHHQTVAAMEMISIAGAPIEWHDLPMSNSSSNTDRTGGRA
jgi:hypothetical protein